MNFLLRWLFRRNDNGNAESTEADAQPSENNNYGERIGMTAEESAETHSEHADVSTLPGISGGTVSDPLNRRITCKACGETALVPRERPAFGTAISCPKCHSALAGGTFPQRCPPKEVRLHLGYPDCSLGHLRCPWCKQTNYSVVFPEHGYEVAWYSNRAQENPNAALVLSVECVHCKKQFVIEWDENPID
jgi:hypothetical protein